VKVVFDTNILVSGLLWKGAPYRYLLTVRYGLADLIVSPPILDELRRVLIRKFEHTASEAEKAVAFVQESGRVIEIPGTLRVVEADSEDDKFIETAQAGAAKLVVSGDRHLLALGNYADISVIGARAFLDLRFEE